MGFEARLRDLQQTHEVARTWQNSPATMASPGGMLSSLSAFGPPVDSDHEGDDGLDDMLARRG